MSLNSADSWKVGEKSAESAEWGTILPKPTIEAIKENKTETNVEHLDPLPPPVSSNSSVQLLIPPHPHWRRGVRSNSGRART